MTTLDPEQTVGNFVRQKPTRARVFESLKIDYCCGGKVSLVRACEKRGIEVSEVLETISTSDEQADLGTLVDVDSMGLTELADHIEALPTAAGDGILTADQRIVTRLATDLKLADAIELGTTTSRFDALVELDRLARRMDRDVHELSDHIAERFFNGNCKPLHNFFGDHLERGAPFNPAPNLRTDLIQPKVFTTAEIEEHDLVAKAPRVHTRCHANDTCPFEFVFSHG